MTGRVVDGRRAARNAYQRARHARLHPGCRPYTRPRVDVVVPLPVTPGAVEAAVRVCGLGVVEVAAVLGVTPDRVRALYAAARAGGAA